MGLKCAPAADVPVKPEEPEEVDLSGCPQDVREAREELMRGGEEEGEEEGGALSSKLVALLGSLNKLREADPTAKSVVFTQFTKTCAACPPTLTTLKPEPRRRPFSVLIRFLG